MKREHLGEEAAILATELLDSMTDVRTIDWRPTREALDLPTGTPLPRPETRRHVTHARGLLTQLDANVGKLPAPADGPGRSGTPDGSPPPGSHAAETLAVLHTAITATRSTIRASAGLPCPATDPRTAVRDLVGLLTARTRDGAPTLTDPEADKILHDLRSWTRTARIDLGWQAPTITLPGLTCPECGHTGTLRAPADASGDVRCTAALTGPPRPDERYPRRCAAIWPRHTWLALLADMQHADAG